MKNILLLVLSALVLASCLPDEDISPSLITYGVVQSPYAAGELGYGITLDGGQFVIPYLDESSESYSVMDNDRILVNVEYSSNDEYYKDTAEVKLLAHAVVPTNDVLTFVETGALDTLGSDPIAIANGSIFQTKNYMNILYSYNQGYTPKSHTVSLVYYPDSTDEDGTIFLKVHHNALGDLEQENISGFKVFDLNTIPPFAEVSDSVLYTIKVNAGDFDPDYAADYFEGIYYKPE